MRTLFTLAIAGSLLAPLHAAAPAPAKEPVESRPALVEGTFSVGGHQSFLNGNEATFQERTRSRAGSAGGVEELVVARDGDRSALRLEARALPGDADYRFNAKWTFDEKLTLDAGYNRIRTFYDGLGGYFRPTAGAISLYDERLAVDRERLWLELGFKPADLPRLRLRYERLTRRGKKPTAARGDYGFTGGRGSRGLVPAFLELDETRDIVTFDVSDEKPTHQWAAGARYERGRMDDARQVRRNPGEATSRAQTTNDGTTSDLFAVHGYALRNVGEKLVVSAGALASTIDTNLDGNRILGPDYDPVYDPAGRRVAFDQGLLDLAGGTRLKQWVGNLNAVYQLTKRWSAHPSVRYEHLSADNMATYIATNVSNALVTVPQSLATHTESQENRLSERFELRYTGDRAWTYAWRADWSQSRGDLTEVQRDVVVGVANIDRASDYQRLSQKYAFSTNWYARPGLTFSGEYFYRLRMNDSVPTRDSTSPISADRYPAFITGQDFATHDFNVRVSWRPASTLTLVTRYDLQRTIVNTTDERLPEIQTGRTVAHIVSQSATWSPVPRLYVTAATNVTFDQMTVPDDLLVGKGDSNYVNTSLLAGYAVSDRSDLTLDLAQFRARNFVDYSDLSMPNGAHERTQSAGLGWTFRASEALTYFARVMHVTHRDETAGGRADYHGAVVYAKVQYRF